jgi:predicted kinase
VTHACPRLVLVTGPAGAGKTTLAHALGTRLGWSVVIRDEIKEALVEAADGPVDHAALNRVAYDEFSARIAALVETQTDAIAEAAFQHDRWSACIGPVLDRCEMRILRCTADPAAATARLRDRAGRHAHQDAQLLALVDAGVDYFGSFQHFTLDRLTLTVDATGGRGPDLDAIVAWVRQ